MNLKYTPTLVPSRPDNPTPLELAIYQYEKSCASFHNKKNAAAPKSETPKELDERVSLRDQDWQHLQLRKISLREQAKLEKKLKEYRAASLKKSPQELKQENHHPTDKLESNLTAIGEVKPSRVHEPHHIIMGKGQYLPAEMMMARLSLHMHGIGINDPVNGVWLANYKKNSETWRIPESTIDDPKHWATPNSPTHRPMHGKNYELWVAGALGNLSQSKELFSTKLRNIKLQLKYGGYPKQVMESYDPQWDGKA